MSITQAKFLYKRLFRVLLKSFLNEKRFEDECYLRGFFACVSSTDQSLDELLDKYRLRNEVEVNFRLMLGDLHRTTRVQSSQRKLFKSPL